MTCHPMARKLYLPQDEGQLTACVKTGAADNSLNRDLWLVQQHSGFQPELCRTKLWENNVFWNLEHLQSVSDGKLSGLNVTI